MIYIYLLQLKSHLYQEGLVKKQNVQKKNLKQQLINY